MLFILVVGSGTEIGAQASAPEASKSTHAYKTVMGHDILADVYQPSTDGARANILFIHGGALIQGHREWANFIDEYVGHGYNVISIDYRLAPETKLPEIVSDVEDAYTWIRTAGPDLFGADPDRIAVVGQSAGGYLALVAGYKFRPKPQAVVSFYGNGDITGPWLTEPSPFYRKEFELISEKMAFEAIGDKAISEDPADEWPEGRGATYLYARQKGIWPLLITDYHPVIDAEWFASYEPIQNVSPDYAPTMLLHGEADTDVPYNQSPKMAKELARHGVDYELVTEPHWVHVFDAAGLEDPTVADAIERMFIFLERHLKD